MKSGNIQPQLDLSEHISPETTGDNINAKRVVPYGWTGSQWARVPQSFITGAYDYIGVTTPDDVTEVYTFKTGGSSGTAINTVTIVYTDNTKATLSSVTRS